VFSRHLPRSHLKSAISCGVFGCHFSQADVRAVRLSITVPWSNGPIEGQINRLKVIKRQMYGRAGFELARYGLSVAAVQDVIMSAIGGENVTTTVEGTPRW
jgi:Cu/Ag efflux pump CusA